MMSCSCHSPARRAAAWAFGLALITALQSFAIEPVAIFSDVYNGYKRTKLPDGTLKPQTYAFANGGMQTRAINDPSLTTMSFNDVARATVEPLRRMNFIMAMKPGETDLMIIVYWGVTQGSSGYNRSHAMEVASSASALANSLRDPPQVVAGSAGATAESGANDARDAAIWQLGIANRERDLLDAKNARILGYRDALQRAYFAPQFAFSEDIRFEVGDNRYYIVLQAYDFKVAMKEKRLKPLWTTRISISEHGKRFDDSVARMVASAARYFGQGDGTLHRYEELKGEVEVGPVEVIETVP